MGRAHNGGLAEPFGGAATADQRFVRVFGSRRGAGADRGWMMPVAGQLLVANENRAATGAAHSLEVYGDGLLIRESAPWQSQEHAHRLRRDISERAGKVRLPGCEHWAHTKVAHRRRRCA